MSGFDRKHRPKQFRSRNKQSEVHLTPGVDSKLKRVFTGIGTPEKKPFTPDDYQLEALCAFQKADCLVTAPTGAGKTWIAEQAIRQILEEHGRAWYASPLKALSNSKYSDFSILF